MKTIVSKLLRDCWRSKGKLLLMVLAAGLSAWGISSVIYSYLMAERDFQVNFARTFPADIEIVVENYREGIEEQFLADENVIDIERREVLGGRIQYLKGEWMPFILFGVEDIQRMRLDVFRVLEEDARSPGKILIETNATYFLDPAKDSIRVRFPNKGEVKWKISGTSHDARLAPARMERAVFAHATSIDLLEPFLKEGQRRLLIETNVSADKKLLQDISGRLKAIAAQAGCRIQFVSIPLPGQHIHQNIVDGISFLQKSFGTILSVMGMILLTWIFPQVGDVGVMKALGASAIRIFYGYVIVLLLIVATGLLLGIPLGYKTATLYNNTVAFIQNFEPVEALLPFWTHAMVAITGMGVPLLFAVRPLSKAARTTVHQAMNKTFYTPQKKFFHLSQNYISESRLKYSVNNLFRNSQRTMLTAFLIAVGLGLFFTASNLEYSVRTELANFARTTRYDLRVRFSQELETTEIPFLYELPFVEHISPMKDTMVTYRPPNAAHTETRSLRILSPDHVVDDDFVLQGKVDKNCKECLYICGEGIKQEFTGVAPGEPVELTYPSGDIKTFRFSGVFKDMAAIGSPFFIIDDDETRRFNALAFEIKPGFSISEASNSIDDALLDHGIEMRGMLSVDRRLASLQGHLEPTYLIIKVMGMFTVLLGFLGLLMVLNLTLQERTREIGILKSIGCSFQKISGIFQLEFLLVSILSIGLGILAAIPLTSALCEVLGETVIHHAIPPKNHLPVIGMTAFLLLFAQTVSISVNNRFKIRKNARELMGYRF
jgi:putative ABC transport system permease protein